MELNHFRDIETFNLFKDAVVKKRWPVEKLFVSENKEKKVWNMIGYCEACERETRFLIDWNYAGPEMPNFRERLLCEHCGLNNRQRFMVRQIKERINNVNNIITDIYIYEQITGFYANIKENLSGINVIGSEYLGYERQPGEVINNIRHEDALNLSFDNKSIDMIVSNDVFEHVPDIEKALREAYRVLRPNGVLLFTVPFYCSDTKTKQRVTLVNGELTHLLQEQYHGNPVSDKGSLVFYDFGWDLLDLCRVVGFKDAYMLAYYSFFYGYLGDGLQYMFIAEK